MVTTCARAQLRPKRYIKKKWRGGGVVGMPRGWLGSYSHPETVRTMDDVINFPHPPTPHPPGEPLSHRLRGTTVVSQYCPVVRCSEGSFREHRDISTADTSRGRYQQPVHPVCRTLLLQPRFYFFFFFLKGLGWNS